MIRVIRDVSATIRVIRVIRTTTIPVYDPFEHTVVQSLVA